MKHRAHGATALAGALGVLVGYLLGTGAPAPAPSNAAIGAPAAVRPAVEDAAGGDAAEGAGLTDAALDPRALHHAGPAWGEPSVRTEPDAVALVADAGEPTDVLWIGLAADAARDPITLAGVARVEAPAPSACAAIPVMVPREVVRDRRGGLRPVYTSAPSEAPEDDPDANEADELGPTCDRTTEGAVPTPFETCLSVRLGAPVWQGTLPSGDPGGLTIPAPEDCEYILVVEGVFTYSATGYQDAARRWHEPYVYDFEPFCTSCGADDLETLVSFVINGQPQRPLAECLFAHQYVYRVTPSDGEIHLAINDYTLTFDLSRHDDNGGGLVASLYTVADDHELLARYVDRKHVLGTPVGASLGLRRLGFEPGGTPLVALLAMPELATFATSASWAVDPAASYVLELRGWATVARGREVDALYAWPPLSFDPTGFAVSGCATELVGADPYAHRYAFRASQCGSTLTVASAHARLAGVILAELFAEP